MAMHLPSLRSFRPICGSIAAAAVTVCGSAQAPLASDGRHGRWAYAMATAIEQIPDLLAQSVTLA